MITKVHSVEAAILKQSLNQTKNIGMYSFPIDVQNVKVYRKAEKVLMSVVRCCEVLANELMECVRKRDMAKYLMQFLLNEFIAKRNGTH